LSSIPTASSGRGGRAREATAGLVDHEDAVGVAVEGEAEVEPAGDHAGLQVELVGGLIGSAGWLGKVPSSSPYMTSSSTWGRRSKTLGTTRPPIPLAVSATTRSGATAVGSMKGHDVVGELVEQVDGGEVARRRRRHGTVAVQHRLRHPPYVGQAGVGADRAGAGQAQLDAVVLRRVVRGREHGAGCVIAAGGEVDEIGRHEADVDDVHPLHHHPLGECGHELHARRAHVPANEDAWRLGELGEGDPEGVGDLRIQLVGDGPTDVVGLDDLLERGHAAWHPRRGL
jgi:hypothetical protein